MLLKLGAVTLAAALAACPGPDYPCTIGDPSLPGAIQIVARDGQGQMVPVADGGALTLTRAPQGGHVLLVGVRAMNAQLCGATVQVALRDPCDRRVAGLENRTVAWRIAGDGWAEPASPSELSDYANLAVCPVASAGEDIDDHAWDLEVRLYQPDRPTIEQTIRVRPTCAGGSDPEGCRCECDRDYDCAAEIDGGAPSCAPDGGAPDAGA